MTGNPIRVMTSLLVVEDDLDLRSLYKIVFRGKYYAVQVAASAEEAQEILDREPDIKVVLLDLTLPGMAGEDLLKTVRARPQFEHLKFLVMSGCEGLGRLAHGIGADGFARKPANLTELEKQVDLMMSAQS